METKIPKTSARKQKNSYDRKSSHHDSVHTTTYGSKTAKDGNKGRSLSKADISKVLSKLEVGGVGEHMADYWVAKELALTVTHHSGQKPSQKLQRPMTMLHIGIHDQGIDAIWKSDKKNIGVMNSKAYAIIEAKASLSMGKGTGPGSLLNDLNKQHDDGRRRKE